MARPKVAIVSRPNSTSQYVEQGLAGVDYEKDFDVCTSDGETIEAVKGADIIINMGVPMPRRVIEEVDKAQAIVSLGHGFDHIDHNAATECNIMVVNCAGFVTDQVSTHTMALLLACARKLTISDRMVRDGEWEGFDSRDLLRPMASMDGQILGIVGFGNIARATARKAKVFGLEVISYDLYVQPWIAREYKVRLVDSLEELARSSDFVSVLVPLNDETRNLLGDTFFKAMKPTAYFINTCRGPVVDEKALIKALQDGEIVGAGIDVFEQEPTPVDNPLLKMDNVIVTPHSAGFTDWSNPSGMVQAGQEAARILRGMWPLSLVNPEVKARIPARRTAANQ